MLYIVKASELGGEIAFQAPDGDILGIYDSQEALDAAVEEYNQRWKAWPAIVRHENTLLVPYSGTLISCATILLVEPNQALGAR